MKFCQTHWDKLRAEVSSAGLDSFVSKDHVQAAVRFVASADGQTRDNFDPLLVAHNMILSNALDLVGIELLVLDQDGNDRCPLCFVTSEHKAECKKPDCKIEDFDHWIGYAVRDTKAEAIRLGLVGSS